MLLIPGTAAGQPSEYGPPAQLQMASEFIQTGKYEEAIGVLKQVPRNSSTYPNALVLLGDAQYYLANYDEANSVYDEAISINSNYFEAWWGKGYALYELGMYEEALAAYDKAIGIKPDHFDAWYQKGVTAFELGRYDEAAKAFDKAVIIDPNNVLAWLRKASTLENLERYEEAVQTYEKVLSLDSGQYLAWLGKGTSLGKSGRYNDALRAFDKAIEIDPSVADGWHYKGEALTDSGRYEEAINALWKALEIDETNVNALNDVGMALFELSRYEEAIEQYDSALELSPNDIEVLSNKGNALAILGRYGQALQQYEKAIEIDPNYYFAWYNKARMFLDLRQYEDAIVAIDEAIERNPTDPDAYNNLGIALHELGKNDEALEAYQKALEIDPNLDYVWNNMGIAEFDRGAQEEATAAFEKAIEIDPNFIPPYHNLGVLLNSAHKYHEAITMFNGVIASGISSAELVGEGSDNLQALAYYEKGIALNQLGLNEEATEAYNNATRDDPTFFQAINNQGIMLNNQGKYDDAIAAYDRALQRVNNISEVDHEQIVKDTPEIHNNKGVALTNLGDPSNAIKEYDRAIDFASLGTEAYAELTERIEYNKSKAASYEFSQRLGIAIALAIGIATWFVAEVTSSLTTRVLFHLQRVQLLHFIPQRRLFGKEQYSIQKMPLRLDKSSRKRRLIASFIIAMATYALLISHADWMTHAVEDALGIGDKIAIAVRPTIVDELSSEDGRSRTSVTINKLEPVESPLYNHLEVFRILAWALTFSMMAFVIVPIDIIESSNLRLHLKSKNAVIAPTASALSSFKVGFSITAIFSIYTIIANNTGSLYAHYIVTLLLTSLPLIPLFYLYSRRKEKTVRKFKEYLKRNGIEEEKAEPDAFKNIQKHASSP